MSALQLAPNLARYAEKRTVERHSLSGDMALYQFAFNQICNPKDWKAPIDALVPWELANVYRQAIIDATGVVPEIERTADGQAHIICIGYRMGPCGDH